MIFGINEKFIILTHSMYFWLFLQILQRLNTAFVLQCHIWIVSDSLTQRVYKINSVFTSPSSSVRNLGVLLHSCASHISSETYFFHLRNIARLRSSLTIADAEILIHALTTSRLDQCNALFLSLPKKTVLQGYIMFKPQQQEFSPPAGVLLTLLL